jgi:site-specific recombinase XerD
MTKDAVRTILSIPNPATKIGLRDIAIMSLEYGTATRIDEVLSLKINNLKLTTDKPYAIIPGKRSKIRTAYLMPGLVDILQKYIKVFHGTKPGQDDYLFYSPWHEQKSKLSQEAIRKRLKIYASKTHICSSAYSARFLSSFNASSNFRLTCAQHPRGSTPFLSSYIL